MSHLQMRNSERETYLARPDSMQQALALFQRRLHTRKVPQAEGQCLSVIADLPYVITAVITVRLNLLQTAVNEVFRPDALSARCVARFADRIYDQGLRCQSATFGHRAELRGRKPSPG